MMSAGGAVVALTLLLLLRPSAHAQDTTAAVRHLLSLDVSRVQPFRRTYDMVVQRRDSTVALGRRDVALSCGTYAGVPAWLLVETRTGVIAAVESLYVAPDMRPVHWSSTLGAARLALEFTSDSIYGATTSPMGKHNIVLGSRPDLLVSGAMVEALLPLLPLTSTWSDSVGVLAVGLGTAAVLTAELAVVGEDSIAVDASALRATWVLALRAASPPRQVIYWIDKETRAALKIDQPLAAHSGEGALLEYRLRPDTGASRPQ